jgi:hypothetical protein
VNNATNIPRVELRTYVVPDAAGNTAKLSIKVHPTRNQVQAEMVGLQYNVAAPVTVVHNAEQLHLGVDRQQPDHARPTGADWNRHAAPVCAWGLQCTGRQYEHQLVCAWYADGAC